MAVDWMPYGLVESGELLTSEDSTKKKKIKKWRIQKDGKWSEELQEKYKK